MHHSVGDLAEVLDNLGVFRTAPQDLVELCPSGFRRVPISTGSDYYLSLQGFAPHQIAYAHTHPDSEEWITVLGGNGEARFGTRHTYVSTAQHLHTASSTESVDGCDDRFGRI